MGKLALFAALTALAVIALSTNDWLPVIPSGQLCKIGDPCLQQWIAAMSGWVGALATIVTLMLLRQQLRDARLHHQQALTLENREHVELAKRIVAQARRCDFELTACIVSISDQRSSISAAAKFEHLGFRVEKLNGALDEAEFDTYNDLIYKNKNMEPVFVKTLASHLREELKKLNVLSVTEEWFDGPITDARSQRLVFVGACLQIGQYIIDLEAHAQRYLTPFGAQIPGVDLSDKWKRSLKQYVWA
ncbi:hypothetical protein GCM10010520_41360 [Rhizobium viscosum]